MKIKLTSTTNITWYWPLHHRIISPPLLNATSLPDTVHACFPMTARAFLSDQFGDGPKTKLAPATFSLEGLGRGGGSSTADCRGRGQGQAAGGMPAMPS